MPEPTTLEKDLNFVAQVAMLAPAAGSGIGKALADALITDKEFQPLMLAAAKGGLVATRKMWAKTGPNGSGELHEEPDWRTRMQTFFGLLAHMEGEPVKRIIHQHQGAAGGIDLKATLRESPELAALLAGELEKANWRKSGRNGKAKQAEAIEP